MNDYFMHAARRPWRGNGFKKAKAIVVKGTRKPEISDKKKV